MTKENRKRIYLIRVFGERFVEAYHGLINVLIVRHSELVGGTNTTYYNPTPASMQRLARVMTVESKK
jgi:hypothetical protein